MADLDETRTLAKGIIEMGQEAHSNVRALALAFVRLDQNTATVRELLEALKPFLEECENWVVCAPPARMPGATVSLQVLSGECKKLLDVAAEVERITNEDLPVCERCGKPVDENGQIVPDKRGGEKLLCFGCIEQAAREYRRAMGINGDE